MLLQLLAWCGRKGQWVLPLGLLGGFLLPWAAEPSRFLIGPCIWLLLFLAVVRLRSRQQLDIAASSELSISKLRALLFKVLTAQVLLPLCVFGFATVIGLPDVWRLAATLVAAASPISGSPNLVMLVKGDDAMALRWLIAGTLLLPFTCLPVLLLLAMENVVGGLLVPSVKLLFLILSATVAAIGYQKLVRRYAIVLPTQVLDGIASIALAVMVIGLMSALHAPATTLQNFTVALVFAVGINVGFQCIGATLARIQKQTSEQIIGSGVVYGNRNIALYLTALPASLTEPLLLFIACYQIPMYLTPLIGRYFYRRLE